MDLNNLIDPEIERPRGFDECISGDESWKKVGIRIKWTTPRTPGPHSTRANVESPIKLRLCVETKVEMDLPPENLTAWCWTPIITETNPRGVWKEIELKFAPKCTQWDDCGIRTYFFSGKVKPVRQATYRLTFNVKYGNSLIWANQFQDDNMASVEMNPSVGTQTPKYPMVHFTSNFADGQANKCIQASEVAKPARLTKTYEDKQEEMEMVFMYS